MVNDGFICKWNEELSKDEISSLFLEKLILNLQK